MDDACTDMPKPDDAVADLTVVVATYNGAAFIEEQLVSICEQTLRPAHIVVTDDGSTDDTPAKARAVLERYPIPFTIGRNPGARGYGNNFFNGIRQASSTYIAFSDQDDIWEPEKIARCVGELERSGAVMCAHGARLIDERGRDLGRFRLCPSRSTILAPGDLRPWYIFYGFSIVFRADFQHLLDPGRRGADFWRLRESLAHDSWASFLGTTLGNIAFIAAPLVRYRQHGRNVVGARQASTLQRLMPTLGPAAHPALNRSAIARRWAAQLGELTRHATSDAIRANAARAATRWMRISAIELSRQRMYTRRSGLARGLSLAVNTMRGHYTRRFGGLGAHYLPKDILVGVLRLREPRA